MNVEPARAQRILREAALLFRTRGYERTTMRDIARAAGVTPGALYWHFPSKEAILTEHLRAYVGEWYGSVRAAIESPEPDAQLREFVRAHVSYQLEQPYFDHGWGTFARSGQFSWLLPDAARQSIIDMDTEYVGLLTRILEHGVAAGVFHIPDVELTAYAILNMGDVLGAFFAPVNAIDPESIVHTFVTLVEQMVTGQRHSGPAKR